MSPIRHDAEEDVDAVDTTTRVWSFAQILIWSSLSCSPGPALSISADGLSARR